MSIWSRRTLIVGFVGLAGMSPTRAAGPPGVVELCERMPDAIRPVKTVQRKHEHPHYLHPKLLGVRLKPGGKLLPNKMLKKWMSYRVAKEDEAGTKGKQGKQAAFLSHVGRSIFLGEVICVFADASLGAREIKGWLYAKGTEKNPMPPREGYEKRDGLLRTENATLEAVSTDALSAAGIKVLPILAIAERSLTKEERERILPPENSSMLRLVLDPFRFHDYMRALHGGMVETSRQGSNLPIKYSMREAEQALAGHHRNRQFQSKKKISSSEALARSLEDLAQSAGRMLALGMTTSVKMKNNDITLGWLADLDEVAIGFDADDPQLLKSLENLAGELVHRKVRPREDYNLGAVTFPVQVAMKLDAKVSEAELKERFRAGFYRGYRASKGKKIKFSRAAIELLDARQIFKLLDGYVRSEELLRSQEYSKAELIDFMDKKGHIDDSVPSGFRR